MHTLLTFRQLFLCFSLSGLGLLSFTGTVLFLIKNVFFNIHYSHRTNSDFSYGNNFLIPTLDLIQSTSLPKNTSLPKKDTPSLGIKYDLEVNLVQSVGYLNFKGNFWLNQMSPTIDQFNLIEGEGILGKASFTGSSSQTQKISAKDFKQVRFIKSLEEPSKTPTLYWESGFQNPTLFLFEREFISFLLPDQYTETSHALEKVQSSPAGSLYLNINSHDGYLDSIIGNIQKKSGLWNIKITREEETNSFISLPTSFFLLPDQKTETVSSKISQDSLPQKTNLLENPGLGDFFTLAKEVKNSPYMLKELLNTLMDIPYTDKRFSLFTQILSYNGEEKSLIDLGLHFKEDKKKLSFILPAIGLLSHPSLESQRYLQKIISSEDTSSDSRWIQKNAQLTLGMVSYHLPKQEKDILTEEILKQTRACHTSACLKHMVSVLGNTGSDRAAVYLIKLIEDTPDPKIRSEATFSLRFIKGTEDILKKILEDDPAPEVRKKAVDALSLQVKPTVLMPYFEKENDPKVKISIISHLWNLNPSSEIISSIYRWRALPQPRIVDDHLSKLLNRMLSIEDQTIQTTSTQ